jgi:hypothetical protein
MTTLVLRMVASPRVLSDTHIVVARLASLQGEVKVAEKGLIVQIVIFASGLADWMD